MKLTDADNAADGIFFPALEQNMMGAVLINENDEVMFFNPAAEKLWGYKREEVIGNNIDMLIPRDLRPAHPEYIRHNREGGKARVEGMSRELLLEKKDGSKIWTRFALSKVSAEGKVYYLALVRDASVEMAQKEQTRQLIIAVDHLDRPVIVLDPERHIVQCNRAFTEMFGYCISEASGMQPDTLLNIPEFPADNRIRLQQLLWKTARDQDEFLLLTRTGEKIWIKASISPVYDVLAHLQNLVMTFSDKSSLNKLGINVKLEKLANATMRDRVGKGDYDIAIGNWSPDFADPYMFMNYWFESDKKGLPGNRSFYENSEVDKLLRNALATTDQTQRTRDYQQAQKIVIDDAAYVYLFQKNYQLAMNKEVKGFVFNPMLEQVFNINTMSK